MKPLVRRGLQPRRLGFVHASPLAKLQNVADGIINPVRLRRAAGQLG